MTLSGDIERLACATISEQTATFDTQACRRRTVSVAQEQQKLVKVWNTSAFIAAQAHGDPHRTQKPREVGQGVDAFNIWQCL
jgi:hypothetical protein